MSTAPNMGAPVSPMLIALLIFVAGRIRRWRKKANGTMSLIADAFRDMQEMRRTAQRRYSHLDV